MSISFAAAGKPRVGAYDKWELEPNYPQTEDGLQVKYVEHEYRALSDLLNSKRTTVRANKFDAAVRHYEKWYNKDIQKFAVGPVDGYTFDYDKEVKEVNHFFGGKDTGDSFLEKYEEHMRPQFIKFDDKDEVFSAAPPVDVPKIKNNKEEDSKPVVPPAAPSQDDEDESDSDDDEESSDDEGDAPENSSKTEALQSILKDMKKLVDRFENALN